MKTRALFLFLLAPLFAFAQPNCTLSTVHCVPSEYSTIQAAVDVAVAGDTVYVSNGTYAGFRFMNTHVSGTAGSPITVLGESQAGVQITTPEAAGHGVNIDTCDYIVIDTMTVTGIPAGNGVRVVNSTGSKVRNVDSHSNHSNGILTGFARHVVVEYSKVYTNGTVAGDHGIYVSNSDVADDNPIIRGNEVYGNVGHEIQINGDCETLDGSGYSDGTITGALVEGNIIHGGTAHSAINVVSVQHSVFRNNLMYGNLQGMSFNSQGSCNIGSSSNVVENNTIVTLASGGTSVRLLAPSTGNLFFNNLTTERDCVIDATGQACDGSDGNTYHAGYEAAYNATGVWTDPASGDYTLLSSSPAKDACLATYSGIAAPPIDLLGNGRPVGSYDCGAYEYGASPAAADTTAPSVPSSISAAPNAYQVTLSWAASTDDREVLGYLIRRDGADYAVSQTNSYTDTSVTPGSSYTYSIAAYDGIPNISAYSSGTPVTVSGIAGCINSDTTWRLQALPAIEGASTLVEFDVTPFGGGSTVNAIAGLSFAVPAAYTDLSAIVQFGSGGTISVRNGSSYSAVNTVTYDNTGATAYHFKLTFNVASHTYSVTVTPAGGAETVLATDYGFRTGAPASVAALNQISAYTDPSIPASSIALCNIAIDGESLSTMKYLTVSTPAGVQKFARANADPAIASNPVFDRPNRKEISGDYTLVASDNGKILYYAGSIDITVTVPGGLGASYGVTIIQQGVGKVTVSGTPVHSFGGGTQTAGQYAGAAVQCTTADACVLWGQIQ